MLLTRRVAVAVVDARLECREAAQYAVPVENTSHQGLRLHCLILTAEAPASDVSR